MDIKGLFTRNLKRWKLVVSSAAILFAQFLFD